MSIEKNNMLQILLKDILEIVGCVSIDSCGRRKLLIANDFYNFKTEITEVTDYMATYRCIILQFINHLTTLKMVKEMEIKHIDAFVKLLTERSKLNVDNAN